jgi:hypothetical protein
MRTRKLVVAAAVASIAVTPSLAMADTPQPIGGLKLLNYCQAQGWETVIFPHGRFAPHAAVNNWRCATGDTSLPINMEQACKWQYGLDAVQTRFTDLDDAFTWVCYTVGNG